jgi:hypothetical protein
VTGAPPAPWLLDGECVVALVRHSGAGSRLFPPLRSLPGPRLVVAARYASSPVGPYLELAVAEPARAGARPGLSVTTMIVDSPDSRRGGRANWGFPKELGSLGWAAEGDERALRWEERGIKVRALPMGPLLPVALPSRAFQRLGDDPVAVPLRLRAWGRPARVRVDVPDGDPLAGLGGLRPGFVLAGMLLTVGPARPA